MSIYSLVTKARASGHRSKGPLHETLRKNESLISKAIRHHMDRGEPSIYLIFLILIFSCHGADMTRCMPENSRYAFGDTAMELAAQNDSILIFSSETKINDVTYTAMVSYVGNESFGLCQLIHNSDTISFYKNELYVWDLICDVNNDGTDDFSIKYQATVGFYITSYLFDKKRNRLSTSPMIRHEPN